MPLKWKLFRLVCIVQMLAVATLGILSVVSLVNYGNIGQLFSLFVYSVIFRLSIFALNLISDNYPDRPVEGKQKKNFNRLFLLNFLFIAFLFAMVISAYRDLATMGVIFVKNLREQSFAVFIPLLSEMAVLVFHFIILYGLYELRRELFYNFSKKEFEFEQPGKVQR